MIPVSHARAAHEAMPASRLEIFESAGHFPFNQEPDRFARVVRDFIAETEAAVFDEDRLRRLLRRPPA
jgi:pimeloyl-ACP methyl ester carboxylesterase